MQGKLTMINDILDECKTKMSGAIHSLEQDLQGMRGNRASTSLVDRLKVEYYGMESELRTLATISTPEPMQILIRPYDKGAVKSIEKAIMEANLGMNPNTDGDVIRLNMPALTRERRQDLVKFLHKRIEDARIALRNVRRSANDDIKEYEKEKMISEDEAKTGQEKVQKMTDEFTAKVEELGKAKEKDIMEL
jgi:ribosome recycling factor